jgi:parallel beta-helix repeat protein
MKSLSFAFTLGALASLSFAPLSHAVTCPDRAPGPIGSPATEVSRTCQNAIAKAGLSFIKAQLKTDAKCMSKQVPGTCPNAKDTAKIQKAALKGRDSVVKACTEAGALGGLSSSYSAFADPADVASCTLSQHNVEGRLLAHVINGTPGVLYEDKARAKCVKTLNSAGVKHALSTLQAIQGCISKAIKANTPGSLEALCVGQWSGGTFTAPTDLKTAEKLAGLVTKLEGSIQKSCEDVNPVLYPTIYACPGAASIADYQNCIACGSWDTTLDLLGQQFNETGTFVANGPGALQAAVDAAGPNAKLLIDSGVYQEQVSMTNNALYEGQQLVGCGGGSDDRPILQPPGGPGPYLNGFFVANVDGLLFQSLEVSGGWEENGIFVTGADGVSFRDVVTDGGDGTTECIGGGNDGLACDDALDCPNGVCTDSVSTYGVFPVESSDVLVELTTAVNIRDAGIYVGSCVDMTVRYNIATANVAGIEIENSTNASVHNNYAGGNVGGMLIFKLPGPTVQRGNLHDVFANVVVNNNIIPNFGIPGTTVAGIPPGTGFVLLSIEDCDIRHNIVQGNNSYGIAAIDQRAFDALAGGALGGDYSHTCAAPDAPFVKCDPMNAAVDCPLSMSCVEDQMLKNNRVFENSVTNNAANPAPGAVGANNIAYAVLEEDPGPTYNNNCFEANGDNAFALLGTPLNNCP